MHQRISDDAIRKLKKKCFGGDPNKQKNILFFGDDGVSSDGEDSIDGNSESEVQNQFTLIWYIWKYISRIQRF